MAGTWSPGHRGAFGDLVKIGCDKLWQKLCFLWLPQPQPPSTCICRGNVSFVSDFFHSSILRYLLEAVIRKMRPEVHIQKICLLIGISLPTNKSACSEPCPCHPQHQCSSQSLTPHPKHLKTKIVLDSSLFKLFHSVIFPLTLRAEDKLLVLLMSLPGHRYRGCPNTNPLSPWPLKGQLTCGRHLQGAW